MHPDMMLVDSISSALADSHASAPSSQTMWPSLLFTEKSYDEHQFLHRCLCLGTRNSSSIVSFPQTNASPCSVRPVPGGLGIYPSCTFCIFPVASQITGSGEDKVTPWYVGVLQKATWKPTSGW